MSRLSARIACAALAVVGTALPSPCGAAVVVWDEGIDGDLSSDQGDPTPLLLIAGTNSVLGTVGGGPAQDWVSITVDPGFELVSMTLALYQSNDGQGFTGFQAGTIFLGSPFDPASYAGYTHFGTAAQNGPLPPTNLVGADLLPLMADPTLSAGATGFTPPLPGGTYAFLFQQLGSTTRYQFDFEVAEVPAPGALGLLGIGAALAARRTRRR